MQPNDGVSTLNHLFFFHLDRYDFDDLLRFQNRSGLMVWSSKRFSHAVFALRQFLLESALLPGDRVALFSENRPEWHIADFALLLSHLVVVPIYNTLSPSQIAYQLRHSGCRAAILAGEQQWGILRPLLPELADMRTVIGMEETAGVRTCLPDIAASTPAFDETAIARIRSDSFTARPDDLATVVYTSGTTGTPKGVMLTHGNIMADLRGSLARVPSNTARQALSILPLPHVLERTLSYGYFHEGVRIAYGDPHDLKELLPIHKPDITGVVPRVLEKVKEAVEAQISLLAPHRRWIAGKLIAASVAAKRAELEGGPPPSLLQRIFAPLANVLVFPKVHRQLQGLKYFISGGAWLNPDVEIFFRAAGFDVLQGYGLTETSPVITLNEYRREKIGSVGRALDGFEVRLEDGEIQTRGPHVMRGYFKDDEATRQAFTADGWLHTGDLGQIDPGGHVTITGRRKEILVLSNGKNIACAPLEHALQRSDYIQQALIVGHGRKFVGALIVAHPENVAQAAVHRGVARDAFEDLLLAPAVIALFRQELDTLQAEFSSYERVKRFCFLNEDALLDAELVTPTQKVRRSVLERKYADWIAQMYQQEDPLVIPRPEQAVTAGSYQT